MTDAIDGAIYRAVDDAKPAVIVCGLPRSGTSLMMQILEALGLPILCDEQRPADASNPMGYYELAAVKSTPKDATWVTNAPGHCVKVVVPLLAYLPQDQPYRVILMNRDLREVVSSQNAMLTARNRSTTAIPEARLCQIFEAQLVETRTMLEQEACFAWIEVQHADLIRAPETSATKLLHFLELEGKMDPVTSAASVRAISAVVDPSLHRERQRLE